MTSILEPDAKISVTIGIRIAKVPQDVPVEKARPVATRNNTGGSINNGMLYVFNISCTNTPASNYTDTKDPKVHANVKIVIAGTIILNPCGMHWAKSL